MRFLKNPRLNCGISVSYTHLYFRTSDFQFSLIVVLKLFSYNCCAICCSSISSVSYTHLDVYKRQAFSEAFKNAGPKILEPIYDVEVFVPSDKMGDVMGDQVHQGNQQALPREHADTGCCVQHLI